MFSKRKKPADAKFASAGSDSISAKLYPRSFADTLVA